LFRGPAEDRVEPTVPGIRRQAWGIGLLAFDDAVQIGSRDFDFLAYSRDGLLRDTHHI
jgi:hypothetical protein